MYRIVFIGTGNYAVECMKTVMKEFEVVGIIQSVRKSEKYTLLQWLDIKMGRLRTYSRKNNIPYICTDDLNGRRVREFIINRNANLICVASAGELLRGSIINLPKYGVLNAHPTLLPDYRGANPHYWIFKNQEKESGVTIHYIDEGMDTGDILLQERFEIPYECSEEDYFRVVNELTAISYLHVLEGLQKGTIERKHQYGICIHKASRIDKRDVIESLGKMSAKEAWHFLKGVDGINRYIYASSVFDYSLLNIGKKRIHTYDIECRDSFLILERKIIVKRAFKRIILRILDGISIGTADISRFV